MSSGGSGPDLFVVCKNCKSEVSPYITECPYCGTRLRKRAPRLDREGHAVERPRRSRVRRPAAPSLGRLRSGEIPGIRGERRPYATVVLVVVSLVGALLWRTGLIALPSFALVVPVDGEWWRVATSPFVYVSTGYAFVALTGIGVFGWLLERRHGPLAVLLVFALAGAGGAAVVAAAETIPLALGGNAAAIALLTAWAVPDIREARRGVEIEGDLLGAAVFAGLLLLLPAVIVEADALAGAVGLAVGAVSGLVLARR